MQEKLKKYLTNVGLEVIDLKVSEKFNSDFNLILETEPKKEDVEKLLTYKVPKLGPDGSCSITDELDDRPYDLKEILRYNSFKNENIYSLVGKLDKIIEFLHKEIGSDWSGVYKKLNTKSGLALVKLSYRGNPSRAEFQLTQKFAEHSNNSTVGLRGRAVLVNSVKEHIEGGKPYYECDNKVQSELCVPVFGKDAEIIGIIDLESFKENFFDDKKIIQVATACIFLSETTLL